MTESTIGRPMLSSALAERARMELAQAFDIRALRVMTDGLRLVIDGDVPCFEVKKRAGSLAGRLAGAHRVTNRLRVVPHRRFGDAELATAVRAALSDHPGLGTERIAVSVLHGVVTLQGSVSSRAAWCEAELAAWAVGGVVDLDNRLQVSDGDGQARSDAAPRLAADKPTVEDAADALTA